MKPVVKRREEGRERERDAKDSSTFDVPVTSQVRTV